MNHDLKTLRRDYQVGELLEDDAGGDPLALFARWLNEAQSTSQLEPNAMTLATVDGMGHPHARIVLL
ncbi:MAG: pyridoxamine 5'-phosphate oxidase family protein, partial [Litorivicinaceae bacterium]|nr:pyridoxamine 5'-phosphate oxidase family protein [Litorivicinaceae bacterium]